MRRRFFSGIALCLLAAGCASQSSPSAGQIDQALDRGAQYLADRQSADGAWRSGVYGFFRDGTTLTPHVMAALEQVGSQPVALAKGKAYLAGLLDARGRVPDDLPLVYPVYTAADASRFFPAWMALLRRHQLNAELGWSPDDLDYGGWSYAPLPPHKRMGAFGGPWDWSNLSATLFALEAIRDSGAAPSDPAYAAALRFVLHCQNTDGGFFFAPTSAIRNKAGSSIDADGREHFNSYGSTTCDGVRALLDCGQAPDSPRVVAARAWLERNFSALHNPGQFIQANEDLRDATYYYYVWSLSQALSRLKIERVATPGGAVDWAGALAVELMRRQRPDGSWANSWTDGKEDDPLVVTPLALSALATCREVLGNCLASPVAPDKSGG